MADDAKGAVCDMALALSNASVAVAATLLRILGFIDFFLLQRLHFLGSRNLQIGIDRRQGHVTCLSPKLVTKQKIITWK
jgi:hypothetical protein